MTFETEVAVDVADEILQSLEASGVALKHLEALLFATVRLSPESPHHANLVELAWYYVQDAANRASLFREIGEEKLRPMLEAGQAAPRNASAKRGAEVRS